jgi:type I restriction enzyme R subunit
MEQDPAFYKKFSRMIDETIEAYKAGRLSELEYLKQMEQTRDEMRTGQDETTPQKLRRYKHAPAYFGVIREPLGQYTPHSDGLSMEELMADLAIKLEEIIERKKVRDWVNNLDVQNQMKREMEDYLVSLKDKYEVPMTYGDIDLILDSIIEVARQRDQL